MPQIQKLGNRTALGVPEKQDYKRKPKDERNGPVIAAKSARAAESQNQNFTKALGGMIKNAEMMAAGKLIQEGRILHTGELGRLASKQVDIVHARRKAALKDPLAAVEKPGKRIKGLRGEIDLDELTELVPSLKKQVEQEKSERAKRERALELELESVAIRAQSSASRRKAHAAGEGSSSSSSSGGLSALMAEADKEAASSSSSSSSAAAAAGAAGEASRKRPRPRAETLKRAIAGARGEAADDGDGANDDDDGEAHDDGNDDQGDGSRASAAAPAKRAKFAAASSSSSSSSAALRRKEAKKGVGSGSRFGVNDSRPGSGAELQPLFGGDGGAANSFADL